MLIKLEGGLNVTFSFKSSIWQGLILVLLVSLAMTGCLGGSGSRKGGTTPAPTFQITDVQNGQTYDHPVTPRITIGEGTTLKSATLNGKAYTLGTQIAQSGTYTLVIVVQNAKGETATATISFTLNIRTPVINITGVEDGGYYNGPVTPVITTDNPTDTITAKLNGSAYQIGTSITAPGKYRLEVTATNTSGESYTRVIEFEIGDSNTSKPARPHGLTVTVGFDCLRLHWQPGYNAQCYNVYRASDAAGSDRVLLTDTPVYGISYRDYDVVPGRVYWYWVQAVNSEGETSDLSEPAASPQDIPEGKVLNVPGECPTVQAAIDAASDGDTIVVQPGIYVENLRLNGKNIKLTSIDPLDSTVVSETIIDGNQKGAVIRIDDGETDAVITGFTITNGTGRTLDGIGHGGGIFVRNSGATISYNNIVNNSVAGRGGAIYLSGAYALISNNHIAGNMANDAGKAVYSESSDIVLQSNVISDDNVKGAKTVVSFSGDNCIITDNTFIDNYSQLRDANPMVFYGDNNLLSGNASDFSLYMEGCHNTVADNSVQIFFILKGESNTVAYNTFGEKFIVGGITGNNNVIEFNTHELENGGLLAQGDYISMRGNSGGVWMVQGNHCLVAENTGSVAVVGNNNTVTNNTPTLFKVDGHNNVVTGNTMRDGEFLNWSISGNGNIIKDNMISGSTDDGFDRTAITISGDNNTIEGNDISGNTLSGWSGYIGIMVTGNGNSIKENTVIGNTSQGGITVIGYSNSITGNLISGNSSKNGGGLHVRGTTAVGGIYLGNTITDNTITDNTASGAGGGLYVQYGTHTISGNIVSGNTSATNGGGLYVVGQSGLPTTVILTGNEFRNNTAVQDGGAVWVSASSFIVDENRTPLSKPDVRNIYSGNTPDNVYYE